jgi:hypothetical protein
MIWGSKNLTTIDIFAFAACSSLPDFVAHNDVFLMMHLPSSIVSPFYTSNSALRCHVSVMAHFKVA